MAVSGYMKSVIAGSALVAVAAVGGWRVHAQGAITAVPGQTGRNVAVCEPCGTPVNDAPNPYKTIENFFPLPDGRANAGLRRAASRAP